MALYDQVSNDIKEAMKARDKVRLETLRNIKKVFKDLANGDININDNGGSPSIKTTNFKIL